MVHFREEEDQKKEAIQAYKTLTARLSDNIRYIGIGYILIYFTIMTNKDAAKYGSDYPIIMPFIGFFGILTLILDYLHYFIAVKSVQEALGNSENGYEYFEDSRYYIWSDRLYTIKQIPCFLGGFLVILLFLMEAYIPVSASARGVIQSFCR